MHEVKIAELSKAAAGKLRGGKHPCQCRMAGKGMPGKSALMKMGNLEKLVKADKKGGSARIKLDEEELMANKSAGTGMMEGGRLKLTLKKKNLKDLGAKSIGAVVGTASGALLTPELGPVAGPVAGATIGYATQKGVRKAMGKGVKKAVMPKDYMEGGRVSTARTPVCKRAGIELSKCQGRVRNANARKRNEGKERSAMGAEDKDAPAPIRSPVASRRAKNLARARAAKKKKQGQKDREDERLGEEVGELRRSARLRGDGLRGGAGGGGLHGGEGLTAGGGLHGGEGLYAGRHMRGGVIGSMSSIGNIGAGGNLIGGTPMGHPAMRSQAASANPFFATQFPPGLSKGMGLY